MNIVVFGGTTEGRELSHELANLGAAVTVCVATAYGEEEQGKTAGIEVRTGPLSPEEKQKLLRGKALCVDATHPYAGHISASVREACEKAGVRRLRLLRAKSETEGFRSFPSAREAAQWLADRDSRIQALDTDMAAKTGEIETLQKDAEGRAGEIKTLTDEAAAKDEEIKTLTADATEKAGQIATLTAVLPDQEKGVLDNNQFFMEYI